MKRYKQFIKEEAELKDTSGVPEDWMDKTDQKAQDELGVEKDQMNHQLMMQIMPLVDRIKRLVDSAGDKEEVATKLSELAIETIGEEFPGLTDLIKTDVKMVDHHEVTDDVSFDDVSFDDVPKDPKDKEEMEQALLKQLEDQEKDEEEKEQAKEELLSMLDSDELKSEIDKQKLINLVQQGEGLNTKKLLHSETSKNGLREIFGDKTDELLRLYKQLTELMVKVNWMIPVEQGAEMMSRDKGTLSGCCSLEWDNDEDGDEEGESQDSDEEDGGEDKQKQLVLKVRAVDYPMLLHELVKGIYLAISVGGFSAISNPDMKKAAKMATSSFRDEAEDFRYGPYVAAELRDFINSCVGSDDVGGIRAYVFGMMVQMPAPEFLELMLGIFEKTDKAKETIESFIRDIKESFDEYNRQEVEHNLDNDGEDDRHDTPPEVEGEPEVDELDKIRQQANEPRGYDSMSQGELQTVLNQLLDDGNYAEIDKLRKYIK
jgi:hypothetical protein